MKRHESAEMAAAGSERHQSVCTSEGGVYVDVCLCAASAYVGLGRPGSGAHWALIPTLLLRVGFCVARWRLHWVSSGFWGPGVWGPILSLAGMTGRCLWSSGTLALGCGSFPPPSLSHPVHFSKIFTQIIIWIIKKNKIIRLREEPTVSP